MSRLPRLLIGGAAALAIVGVAAAVVRHTHVITVRLPGGGAERVFYTGDVAPRVTFATGSPMLFTDPFALMDRISADMDRETAAMFGPAEATLISPERLLQENLDGMAALPVATRGYAYASSLSGTGVCGRSVEITSPADGARPTVVTRTFGDCVRAHATPPPARAPAAPDSAAPQLVETLWEPVRPARTATEQEVTMASLAGSQAD